MQAGAYHSLAPARWARLQHNQVARVCLPSTSQALRRVQVHLDRTVALRHCIAAAAPPQLTRALRHTTSTTTLAKWVGNVKGKSSRFLKLMPSNISRMGVFQSETAGWATGLTLMWPIAGLSYGLQTTRLARGAAATPGGSMDRNGTPHDKERYGTTSVNRVRQTVR